MGKPSGYAPSMPVATDGCIALYLRISIDRAGRREGVERQEKWGRSYAERMIDTGRWPNLPIKVFKDNNLSAFEADTHREGYEELRTAIRASEVRHLWSVEQTRLEANRKRWVELVAELDDAGLREIHTDRDGIVRLDEVADIKQILAWHERKRLRERVRDTKMEHADEGRPSGGACFGYKPAVNSEGTPTLAIVPRQAEAARWAAEAVKAGWGQAAIARELERQGVPTARGGKWTTATVRHMLTAPTIAGLRVYKGEVHRKGNWEPILDENTWREVGARLAGPRMIVSPDGSFKRVATRQRTRRRWLLTGGIAVCGRCSAPLVAKQRHANMKPAYLCQGPDGCNGLGIGATPLEDHVRDELIVWLDSPASRAAAAEDEHQAQRDDLTAALAEVARRKVSLTTRWTRGDLDDEEWDIARADLEQQRSDLSAALAAVPPPAAAGLDPDELREDWAEMTLGERRLIVAKHLDLVTVHPAKRRGGGFDPDRVTIRFVGE